MNVGDVWVGVSGDGEIAARGENGGVVTSLLKLALEEGIVDGVLAVSQGASRYEGIPTYVTDPQKLAECAGSLHFASPSLARSLRKHLETHSNRVAVVCRSCDARAVIELAKINQVDIDNVLMIGLNCSGTLSPVPHIEMVREMDLDPYRLEWEDIDGSTLVMRFEDGQERTFDLEDLEQRGLGRRANCLRCEHPVPRMADLACGKWGLEGEDRSHTIVEIGSEKGRALLERAAEAGIIKLSAPSPEQMERRRIQESEKVTSAGKRQDEDFRQPEEEFYWFSQFENCIKCYGCRDACPMCHCKRCVLERDVPETVARGVVPPPPTFGMIRFLHVACHCVNCGQCEDVCSADIPLSRLGHFLSKTSSRLFDYEAGTDITEPLPLCAIPEEEKRLESPEMARR
jgi:formate dehydrogenase subunit beta